MRSEVVALLQCPLCNCDFDQGGSSLYCGSGHSFDVARQGYVNLLAGHRPATSGDDPAMVSARLDFLAAGHYTKLAQALGDQLGAVTAPGAMLDIGCGTGYYLASALPPGRVGLGLDVSVPAARRAARAHPDVGVAVADSWHRLPVRDGVASAVLNVFAPRNGPEFARVLHPTGRLVVVTPAPGHLTELITPLGLLAVDEDKQQRLDAALAAWFAVERTTRVEIELHLDASQVAALVGMSPSARHVDPAALEQAVAVRPIWSATASFDVGTYRRVGSRSD